MAIFSVNQTRQLYVALAKGEVNGSASLGTLDVKGDKDKSYFYFVHKGHGGPVRSDLIKTSNILYIKATSAKNLNHKKKALLITLNSGVNNGEVIQSEDYILKLNFLSYLGMSPNHTYFKFGAVRGSNGMTVSNFYKNMAISLINNLKREPSSLVDIYLKTSDNKVPVNNSTNLATLTETYTGLIIVEGTPEWSLGKTSFSPVSFNVEFTPVRDMGIEKSWGTIQLNGSTVNSESITVPKFDFEESIKNGMQLADLEYFCMGFRGDIHRNSGQSYISGTKYLIDPSKEYAVMDIHYFDDCSNEAVQKSEKTITIVAETAVMNTIIADVKTSSDKNIANVS